MSIRIRDQKIYPPPCLKNGVTVLRSHPVQTALFGICLGMIAATAIVFLCISTDAAKTMGMAGGFQWVEHLGMPMAARWGVAGGIAGITFLFMFALAIEWRRQGNKEEESLPSKVYDHDPLENRRSKPFVLPQRFSVPSPLIEGSPKKMVMDAVGGQESYERLDILKTNPKSVVDVTDFRFYSRDLTSSMMRGEMVAEEKKNATPFIVIRYRYKDNVEYRDNYIRVVTIFPKSIIPGVQDADPDWSCIGYDDGAQLLFVSAQETYWHECLTKAPRTLQLVSEIVNGTNNIFELTNEVNPED